MAAPPPPPPPPPTKGLSLYDDLKDPNDPPSSSAIISSAPVRYDQVPSNVTATDTAKKFVNPAFQFQPIRRPPASKPKPKASFPRTVPNPPAPPPPSGSSVEVPISKTGVHTPPAPPVKSTLADWAATEEDEWRYGAGGEKHQRGGRKKKKRKQQESLETNWDDIYDPSRPTEVVEYLNSDEKLDEVREWRALLNRHKHQVVEADVSSDEDETRPSMSNQFAPPTNYEFAPPPQSPPELIPDDRTGDDAYARRLAMTQGAPQMAAPPPPPEPPHARLPPPHPSDPEIITAAPVRYAQTSQDEQAQSPPRLSSREDITEQEAGSQPRSNRPGQTGFAHRLMSKYGWTSGTGLGASSTGIVTPLRAQPMKRKKRADADGGGWAEPAKGKIVGGLRRSTNTGPQNQGEDDGFGRMSEVIVLHHMLDGMDDLAAEIEDGLGQEIGEECGEKYGRVERLYIDQDNRQVFIKFTDQVSALRAVNELNGRIFNGNTIVPKFYDVERFEEGQYVLR